MNIDPLFMTIGLAAEREWGLAEDYNPGKFWPQ